MFVVASTVTLILILYVQLTSFCQKLKTLFTQFEILQYYHRVYSLPCTTLRDAGSNPRNHKTAWYTTPEECDDPLYGIPVQVVSGAAVRLQEGQHVLCRLQNNSLELQTALSLTLRCPGQRGNGFEAVLHSAE